MAIWHRWSRCLIPLLGVVGLACASADRPIALTELHGRIVLSRGDDIWSAGADGSGLRRLTRRRGPEFDPSWAPDGSRIAYRDSRRGINRNDEIYVMDADGSHRRNLTHSGFNEWSPAWSPDGRSIAFTTTHDVASGRFDVWIMRTDGSAKRRVAPGSFPAWSPDGRFLMFSAGGDADSDRLSVARPDGSGLRPWPISGWLPDWMP